jgi:hypothetical protein
MEPSQDGHLPVFRAGDAEEAVPLLVDGLHLGFKQRVDSFYEYSSTGLKTASACIFYKVLEYGPWPTESGTEITREISIFW